jgi:hypothetical protein
MRIESKSQKYLKNMQSENMIIKKISVIKKELTISGQWERCLEGISGIGKTPPTSGLRV